jgi:UDP-glucose 4-epimerase
MTDRVLITGGAGFIGSWLTRALLARGKHLRVLDDLSTGSLKNLPDSDKVDFIQGSVRDEESVAKACKGVDLIIHLAGLTGMRLAHSLKHESYSIASQGTACVIDNSPPAARLVLMSSSAVYGLTSDEIISEDRVISDKIVCSYDGGEVGYAAGKWELEQLGLAAAASGRQVLTLRPFNVVGPGQSSRYGMVVPTFVRHALAGKDLIVHDLGKQTRSFCDVRTFCDVMLALIERPKAWERAGAAINIGNPNQCSIRQLAQMVLDESGSSSSILYQPYSQVFPGRTDVKHRIPDTHLLHTLLDRPNWMDIRAIVRETLLCESTPENKWSEHRFS